MIRIPRRPFAWLTLGTLLVTACGEGREAARAIAPGASGVDGTGLRADLGRMNPVAVTGERSMSATARPGAASAALTPVAQDSATRMLIRRGHVFVRVDSLERAMAAVRALAAAHGGVMGNVSVTAGEYEVRAATLTLRIPVARFDSALAGLDPIGRVESSEVTAEDVGEEYVDASARMANSRRLEDRLVSLLANRTGRLEDVLAVERELARVRQEIESYEARLRYLRSNIAMSTLVVTVSERSPLVSPTPGRWVLVDAFVQAWRNFVRLVAFAIESLGFLVPLALIVALWRGRRARRHDG